MSGVLRLAGWTVECPGLCRAKFDVKVKNENTTRPKRCRHCNARLRTTPYYEQRKD